MVAAQAPVADRPTRGASIASDAGGGDQLAELLREIVEAEDGFDLGGEDDEASVSESEGAALAESCMSAAVSVSGLLAGDAPLAAQVPMEGTVVSPAEVMSQATADADVTGLADSEDATAAAVSGPSPDAPASSGADAAPPPPPPPAEAGAPRPELPSPMGYVYLGGRSIGRVIRGKPARSLSVRCYVHTSCSFLLPLRLAPSDSEICEWLVAEPAAPPGATTAQRQAAAKRHIELAKRWRQGAAGQAS